MSKITKFFVGLTGSLALLLVPVTVKAQSFLPDFLKPLFERKFDDPGAQVTAVISSVLTVIFIVVFVVAIVYTFIAAIKYIRSEGNEQKVEEAKNAVKAVLFGVGAMFVAILGIVLITALFGINDPTGGLAKAINDIVRAIKGS